MAVHSVFDNAVNVSAPCRMLSVVNASSGECLNGPGRIVIWERGFSFGKILKQSDTAKFSGSKLFFSGGVIVNLENSSRWFPEIKNIYVRRIDTGEILFRLKDYSFIKPKIADKFKNAVETSDKNSFNSAARALTGLGYGLTPSGDDFLVGFISASHYLVRCKPFSFFLKNIKIDYSKTNYISSQYLKYAVGGKISEIISNTIVSSALREPSARHWISALANTGATSGCDTLFGILAAIEGYNACKRNKEKFLS